MRRRVPALVLALTLVPLVPAAGLAVGAEPTAEITGEIWPVVLDMEDGAHVELTFVVADDGEVVPVDADAVSDVPAGATVRLEIGDVPDGLALTDPEAVASVDALRVLAAPSTPSAPSARVESGDGLFAQAPAPRPVHVVTARLPGQSGGPDLATVVSEVAGPVSGYWKDSTDGTVSFAVAAQAAHGTVPGWNPQVSCGSQAVQVLLWLRDVTDVQVGGGRHAVLHTPWERSCGFAGIATTTAGGGLAWVNGPGPGTARWTVTAHELGHTLGLGHSDSRYACPLGADGGPGECSAGAYGDAYDVMGIQDGDPGPVGFAHRDVLGITSGMQRVTAPATVDLTPVAGPAGATRALSFTREDATYYVEYRGAVGRDANLAGSPGRRGCPTGVDDCFRMEQYVPGVVVHRVDGRADGAATDTHLLDVGGSRSRFAMGPGDTFRTADGALTLTVETAGATARVRLTQTPPPGAPLPEAGAVYLPVDPVRVVQRTRFGPEGERTFRIPGAPPGAVAAALNITSTRVTRTSYVSACAGDVAKERCRLTSVQNPSAGVDTGAAAIVALGGTTGDQVKLYNNAGDLDLIADLHGWYVEGGAAAAGGELVTRTPQRVMTRRLGRAGQTTLRLADVPAGATAVVLNVTSDHAPQTSFVSACPAGQHLDTCKETSVLNPAVGRARANAAVVRLGGPQRDSIQLYNNAGSVNLKVDVAGWFVDSRSAGPEAARYHAMDPVRIPSGQGLVLGSERHTDLTVRAVPPTATAVAANLTAHGSATAVSFVSACPARTAVAQCKQTSVVNPYPRVDTSNSAVLPLGPGSDLLIYNNRGTVRLYVDLLGYFHP